MARILVIDDDQRLRDLLDHVFRRKGHEVVLAESGSQGVERFRQERVDVTILDLDLPDLNGLAVLTQIRAIAPQAPVIILTGVGTKTEEQQARALGVTDFLEKGFSLHMLGEAMSSVLSHVGGPAGSISARPRSETGRMKERRHFPRSWVQIPISLLKDGVIVGEGIVYDLSTGGCAVESQVNVLIGDNLALQLYLPDRQAPTTPLMVEVAAVRWTIQQKFGLEFIRMPVMDQKRLRRYVKTLQTTSH